MPRTFYSLIKIIFLTIVTLLSAPQALATNGIFVTLQTGIATQSGLPSADQANATSLDTNLTPPALRAAMGYNHDLNSYLGLGMEAGFGQYGESVYHYAGGGSTTVKSQDLEFLALLTTHLQKFDLITKIGGVREETEVTGENAPSTDHRNNPAAGIEVAYNFSPHFAATISYEHVFGGSSERIKDISVNSASIDEYLLGVRYTFAS